MAAGASARLPRRPADPTEDELLAEQKGAFTLLVGALFLAVALTPKAQSASPSAATAPTWSSASPVVPAAAVPAEPADDSTPAASSDPKTSFGDGTWVVGEDIVAGTYKSAGAQSGAFELCSVTTLAGDTSDSEVIDWLTANADEPLRIKVSGKVKAVKATGCEDFTKVA